MTGMPLDLYMRCRTVLIRCDDFSSQAKLRSVFAAGELITFQSSVPEGGSRDERVGLVIDYLQSRYLSNKRPALSALLQVLCLFHHEDKDLADELAALHEDIDRILGNIKWIELPLVVAAMTGSEAGQLLNLTDEGSNGQAIIATEFVSEFQRYGFDQSTILCQYGQEREDWQPYPEMGQSVRDIIADVLGQVNEKRATDGVIAAIKPVSYSETFFSADHEVRLETYKTLSRGGCMLIIDPLSLFSSQIMTSLIHSGLVLNTQRVATIILSPIDLGRANMYRRIAQQINDSIPLSRARHEEVSDALFEFGVADMLSLKRCLYRVIPDLATIVETLSLQTANRSLVEKYGQPQGIHRLFPGVRG